MHSYATPAGTVGRADGLVFVAEKDATSRDTVAQGPVAAGAVPPVPVGPALPVPVTGAVPLIDPLAEGYDRGAVAGGLYGYGGP